MGCDTQFEGRFEPVNLNGTGSLANDKDRIEAAIAGLQFIRVLVGEGSTIRRAADAVLSAIGTKP